MPESLSLVVVVPALDARHQLERSLPALLADPDLEPGRIVLVDDGSVDGTADWALGLGVQVVQTASRRSGPAAARNLGVQRAPAADWIAFVDADVVVEPGALTRLVRAAEEGQCLGAFGSYDAEPDHRGFASLYVNLRHHAGHRVPSLDADTFWSGLGVVRRRAFLEAGGFDAARFPEPSVEDVELGLRLRAAGDRIARVPGAQAKHLKRWTVLEALRVDVLRRALPWSRLMVEHPGAFRDLNVSMGERVKAALACALLFTAAAAVLPWSGQATLLSVGACLLLAAVLLSLPLLVIWARSGGVLFAAGALLFHQLHLALAAGTFAWVRLGLPGAAAATAQPAEARAGS
ncbi:MAG: glycosyltransferase family 2 protein [Planctomycetota bacterium]|nr:glycosyltransferase family 2 protein [Planctomycetota bacterium]